MFAAAGVLSVSLRQPPASLAGAVSHNTLTPTRTRGCIQMLLCASQLYGGYFSAMREAVCKSQHTSLRKGDKFSEDGMGRGETNMKDHTHAIVLNYGMLS